MVNSHLYHDHSGGNEAFPNATFLVQRAELEAIRTPQVAKAVGYLPADCAMNVSFEVIDGEHDIFGDGTLLLTPTAGHTPGHQSLRVTLSSGQQIVLAGDACYLRETLAHMRLPKVVWDTQQALQSLARLQRLAQQPGTMFVPGHDPVAWAAIRHAPASYE